MYEIFKALCDKRGITPYVVSKDTGISQATLSDWKRGKHKLSLKNKRRLADYFKVTIEYLDGRTVDSRSLSETTIDDDQIKFALFGGEKDITNAQYEEVKQFAQFIKDRDRLRRGLDLQESMLYAARGRKDEDIIEDVAMRFDEALRKERDSKNTPK